MGMFGSKEKEVELKSESQKRIDLNAAQMEREEKIEKERTDKELKKSQEEDKRRREKEIEEEKQRGLKLTEEKVNRFKEARSAGEKRLAELEQEIIEKNAQMIEDVKKNGVEKVTKLKEDLQKDKEKLIEQEEKIKEGLNEMQKTHENMLIARGEIVKKIKEEEKKNKKEHEEKILQLVKQNDELIQEAEKQKTKTVQEYAEVQKTVMVESSKAKEREIVHVVALIDALGQEQTSEDFKRSANQLVTRFNRFTRNFDEEDINLISTRDEIDLGIRVNRSPDLSRTLQSLGRLLESLQGFNAQGADDIGKYEKLRDDVIVLVRLLVSKLNDVVSRNRSYQNVFNNSSTIQTTETPPEPNQKTRLVSMTPSEDEEFDVLDTSSTKGKSPPTLKGKYENFVTAGLKQVASEQFSIRQHYDEIIETIRKLSGHMLGFNVRSSNVFNERLAIQRQELLIGITAESIAQITNGQSHSDDKCVSVEEV